MKALFVLPSPIIGGAERVAFNVINYLLENQWVVSLYIVSKGAGTDWLLLSEKYPNFKLIAPKYSRELTGLIGLLKFIWSIRKLDSFDLVFSTHTHINGVLSLFRRLKFIRCASLVSRESTFILERFFGLKRMFFIFIYKYCYGQQNLLICQTNGMKKSLVENLGFEPCKNIVVIKNPLYLKEIDSKILSVKMELAKPIIVCCGRLIKLKGFDKLIIAYDQSLIRNKYDLVIIGDGSEVFALKDIIKKCNLGDSVRMLGNIDNPFIWFALADIGIISSDIEGFPNVLIEMMASSIKSIITTPCTDGVFEIPKIYITDNSTVDAMVRVLNKFIEKQDNNSLFYRAYVESEHSIDNFVEKCIKAGVL